MSYYRLFYLCVFSCFLSNLMYSQQPTAVRLDSSASQDTLHYILNDIVVTGTRTEKRIIDIPYAIQRIDNSQFRFNRKVSVSDVLGTVPGMFLQSRYGNHDVRISIRGFGSRSNSGIRGVRILLDGIPESEPDGQTRIEAIDFESIGSIEIVKGNASSLYTNAPGGVVNFINDIDFENSFLNVFSSSGSFGLQRSGAKAGYRNDNYTFLATYSDHKSNGFRKHSQDDWKILNTVLEAHPSELSRLQILGYFVKGDIRLPGSLTREQIEEDPLQANQRDVDRDSKRVSNKGRIGLRLNTYLDKNERHQIEFTGYGTIKYFERASGVFRIINRYGLGASGRYILRYDALGRKHDFSVGGDLLYQTGPIEFYDNIAGERGDNLNQLFVNTIGNGGLYFLNTINLLPDRLDMLFTGRYDNVYYDQKNQLFTAVNRRRDFDSFTPKLAFNYKPNSTTAIYASAGKSFTSPASNELDNYPLSSDPNGLLNPDIKPQESVNFEVGIKSSTPYRGTRFFNDFYAEATLFSSKIQGEIVPFEVFGEVFFRNAAQTNRTGLELGLTTGIYGPLRFEGAYTWSNFNYDTYTARSIEFDNGGNQVNVDRDFSGNTVPSVPKHNLSTNLSFSQRLSQNITGFTRIGHQFVSGLFVDDQNSDQTDSYQIVNLTAGADLLLGSYNLLINGGVNNIADVEHIAFINLNSSNATFFEAGEPRHFFISMKLGYRF
ncbi:MAG: TonB-dependent receptor family protein [Calditrichia bacterium]